MRCLEEISNLRRHQFVVWCSIQLSYRCRAMGRQNLLRRAPIGKHTGKITAVAQAGVDRTAAKACFAP